MTATTTATIGRNGEVTIPPEVRAAARLDEGDEVEFEVTENGILIRFHEEDLPDPWYYDTPEWEEGVKRAMEDVAAGRMTYHNSNEEFLAALARRSKRADT